MAYGYQPVEDNDTGILHQQLLAYSQDQLRLPVVLKGDTVGPGGVTVLEPGLMVARLDSGAGADEGKYTHYLAAGANGQGEAANAGLLWARMDFTLDQEDQLVSVLIQGHVRTERVIFQTPADAATFDWAACGLTNH